MPSANKLSILETTGATRWLAIFSIHVLTLRCIHTVLWYNLPDFVSNNSKLSRSGRGACLLTAGPTCSCLSAKSTLNLQERKTQGSEAALAANETGCTAAASKKPWRPLVILNMRQKETAAWKHSARKNKSLRKTFNYQIETPPHIFLPSWVISMSNVFTWYSDLMMAI